MSGPRIVKLEVESALAVKLTLSPPTLSPAQQRWKKLHDAHVLGHVAVYWSRHAAAVRWATTAAAHVDPSDPQKSEKLMMLMMGQAFGLDVSEATDAIALGAQMAATMGPATARAKVEGLGARVAAAIGPATTGAMVAAGGSDVARVMERVMRPPIDWRGLYSTEGLPKSGAEVLERRKAEKKAKAREAVLAAIAIYVKTFAIVKYWCKQSKVPYFIAVHVDYTDEEKQELARKRRRVAEQSEAGAAAAEAIWNATPVHLRRDAVERDRSLICRKPLFTLWNTPAGKDMLHRGRFNPRGDDFYVGVVDAHKNGRTSLPPLASLYHHRGGFGQNGYYFGYYVHDGPQQEPGHNFTAMQNSIVVDDRREFILCAQTWLRNEEVDTFYTLFWLPISELSMGAVALAETGSTAGLGTTACGTIVCNGGMTRFVLAGLSHLAGCMDAVMKSLLAARACANGRVVLMKRLRHLDDFGARMDNLFYECLFTRVKPHGLSDDPHAEIQTVGLGRNVQKGRHIDLLARRLREKRQHAAQELRRRRNLRAQEAAYDAMVARLARRTAAAAIANIGAWADARAAEPYGEVFFARLRGLNPPALVESANAREARMRWQRGEAAGEAAERAERRAEAAQERDAALAAEILAVQHRQAERAAAQRARRAARWAVVEREQEQERLRVERNKEAAFEQRRLRQTKAADAARKRARASRAAAVVQAASRDATRLLRIARRRGRALERAPPEPEPTPPTLSTLAPPPLSEAPPSPSTQVPSYPSTAVGSGTFECSVCFSEDVALGVLVDCRHGFCLACCRKLTKCPKCNVVVRRQPLAVFF